MDEMDVRAWAEFYAPEPLRTKLIALYDDWKALRAARDQEGPLGELQALVTGAVTGALMTASADWLDILVEPVHDEAGYRPEVYVRGIVSGEAVRVRIEREP